MFAANQEHPDGEQDGGKENENQREVRDQRSVGTQKTRLFQEVGQESLKWTDTNSRFVESRYGLIGVWD